MSLSRSDFMKLLGVTLASLLLTNCGGMVPGASTPRQRLRSLWFKFDELAKKSSSSQGDDNKYGQQLLIDHRAALDELVVAGELSASAADLVQESYGAAVYHVWRSNAPITCYEPMMVDYAPKSANLLVQQSEILGQLAKQQTIDPVTLQKAQAALEHDMAYFDLSDEETQALYQRILEQNMQNGQPMPSFEDLVLELSPDAREAARFIIDLLTEK